MGHDTNIMKLGRKDDHTVGKGLKNYVYETHSVRFLVRNLFFWFGFGSGCVCLFE